MERLVLFIRNYWFRSLDYLHWEVFDKFTPPLIFTRKPHILMRKKWHASAAHVSCLSARHRPFCSSYFSVTLFSPRVSPFFILLEIVRIWRSKSICADKEKKMPNPWRIPKLHKSYTRLVWFIKCNLLHMLSAQPENLRIKLCFHFFVFWIAGICIVSFWLV